MKKEFTSYKISLELKSLGFDEPCLAYYTFNSDIIHKEPFRLSNSGLVFYHQNNIGCKESDLNINNCIAPLWQQVIDWLEHKYKLFIDVFPILVESGESSGHRFTWTVSNLENYTEPIISNDLLGFLTSYEARENAILKVIEFIKSYNTSLPMNKINTKKLNGIEKIEWNRKN